MSILFDTFKKQASSVGNFLNKAVDFIPGGKLGQGIGYALSGSYINKLEQESLKRGDEVNTLLQQKIQENKTLGKSNDRLLQISSELNKSPQVSRTILEDAPTTKQIIASSAELAALAAMGLKTPLQGVGIKPMTRLQVKQFTSLAKESKAIMKAAKLKNATDLTKKLYNIGDKGLKIGKGMAEGAALMGLAEVSMKRDAQVEDIIK